MSVYLQEPHAKKRANEIVFSENQIYLKFYFRSKEQEQTCCNTFLPLRRRAGGPWAAGLLLAKPREQNACARLIFSEEKSCHVTPLIYGLHWFPIKYRIDFKILLITFKILNSLAPTYLSSLVSLRLPSKYNLRNYYSLAFACSLRKLKHKYLCHELE